MVSQKISLYFCSQKFYSSKKMLTTKKNNFFQFLFSDYFFNRFFFVFLFFSSSKTKTQTRQHQIGFNYLQIALNGSKWFHIVVFFSQLIVFTKKIVSIFLKPNLVFRQKCKQKNFLHQQNYSLPKVCFTKKYPHIFLQNFLFP